MSDLKSLRLAIVNDYQLVVAGVAAALGACDPQIQVVELDSRVPSMSLVDIVLLDTFAFVSGGQMQLCELVEHARRSGAKVVVYSWSTDAKAVRRALSDGAEGYLWKGLGAAELVEALNAVNAGKVVTRMAPSADVEAETPLQPAGTRWPGRAEGLTAREAEVVALIARGMSNQDIASELYLGLNTIKTHIRTAYRKMGVVRRAQAVLWAVENGFDIQPERHVLINNAAGERSTTHGNPGPRSPGPQRTDDVARQLSRRAIEMQSLVPQCTGFSLASNRDEKPFTVAATRDEIAALDAVQYLDSGPCMAAARSGEVLACTHEELRLEPTWVPFAAATAEAGVSSTLSMPILDAGRVIGTINLYALTDDAFNEQHRDIAAIFEGWATRSVANFDLTRRRINVENKPQHLRDDIDIRAATGKFAQHRAITIQQARHRIDDAAHRAGITRAQLARTILGVRRP